MNDPQPTTASSTPNVQEASMEPVDQTSHVRSSAPTANGHTKTTGVEFFQPFCGYVLFSCVILIVSFVVGLLCGGEFNAWTASLDWRMGTCLLCIVGAACYKIMVCEKEKAIREKDETIRALELKISALTSNKVITVPDAVMKHKVFTFLRLKDYFHTSCVDRHLRKLWEKVLVEESVLLHLHVPEDCRMLEEAVNRVHRDRRLTSIVLGKGHHQIDGDYLKIFSSMSIVGDPDVPRHIEIASLKATLKAKDVEIDFLRRMNASLEEVVRTSVSASSSETGGERPYVARAQPEGHVLGVRRELGCLRHRVEREGPVRLLGLLCCRGLRLGKRTAEA